MTRNGALQLILNIGKGDLILPYLSSPRPQFFPLPFPLSSFFSFPFSSPYWQGSESKALEHFSLKFHMQSVSFWAFSIKNELINEPGFLTVNFVIFSVGLDQTYTGNQTC